MFNEEAHWIRDRLAARPLPPGARVLDLGSSTREYRTVIQPHIDELVYRPLAARGCRLVSADAKRADGVDVLVDLADPVPPPALTADPFDLVICSNLLQHVPDPVTAMAVAAHCVKPGGLLLVTAARRYLRTTDPIDNGFRPRTRDLAALAGRGACVAVLAAEEIGISDPRYYLFRPGRLLDHLLLRAPRMRWRGRIPFLHWRVSCALLQLEPRRP